MISLLATGAFNLMVGAFSYHHYGIFRQRWALFLAILNFGCAFACGAAVLLGGAA